MRSVHEYVTKFGVPAEPAEVGQIESIRGNNVATIDGAF
jgi:hypothetical protein